MLCGLVAQLPFVSVRLIVVIIPFLQALKVCFSAIMLHGSGPSFNRPDARHIRAEGPAFITLLQELY